MNQGMNEIELAFFSVFLLDLMNAYLPLETLSKTLLPPPGK